MKLTIVLLTAAFMHVQATSLAQNVTLSGKSLALKEVFTAVKKQTGYSVLYSLKALQSAQPVTISAERVPLERFLTEIFKQQPDLDYAIKGKDIFVFDKIAPAKVASLDDPATTIPPPVYGIITDSLGKPLIGATIRVKGKNIMSISDENGRFSITANKGDVLVISFVGYKIKEITVADAQAVNVALTLLTANLDEVNITINTGYQQISKERFVGAYAQLDSAAFHRRAGMNIIDRLDGTVPGVVFDKKGSQTFPIEIRGISTLGGPYSPSTYPLVVVDNFPMDDRFDINSINPNDVESISVLKDAAAASIWGTRAGNGVIVITTKRGGFNQPFRVSVSSNITLTEKPDLFYFPRVQTSDFIDIERMLFSKGFYNSSVNNTSTRPVISPVVEILARQKAGLLTDAEATAQMDALRNLDLRNDLDQYVYRNALNQQHYLGFTGGTSSLSYQFSFGYNHSLNNIQDSKPDDQYTITTNTVFRPLKKLEIKTGINISQGLAQSYDFSLPNSVSPYARLVTENGLPAVTTNNIRQGYIDTAGGGRLLDWNYRPLDEIRFADNVRKARFLRLNVGIDYNIFKWLKANVQYQHMSSNDVDRDYRSLKTWYTRDFINRYTNFNQTDDNLRYPVPKGGIMYISNSESTRKDFRAGFTVNNNWGSEHALTALIATEISEAQGYSNSEQLFNYDKELGTYRNNMDYFTRYPRYYAASNGSTGAIPWGGNYDEKPFNRFVSLLANASYTYNNRYTLYASARRDGSNLFGVNTNNKWKPLWSVGGSWDISKENFYHVNWLNSLRFRASYGYTGNVNNGLSGKFYITYNAFTSTWTNSVQAQPGNTPNEDLKWENVGMTNLGLDFSLLRGQVSGSIEYFNKKATDLISNVPIDPTSGVTVFPLNYGSLKGNGFDFTLTTRNISRAVSWTSNFSISYAKTIITEVYTNGGEKASTYALYSLNAYPGRIAFGISGYRWAGLDPLTGDPVGYLNGQVSKNYSGIQNDSIQNQVFYGSQQPLYSSFLTNNISWKGFTLSLNITGRFNFYFRQPAISLNYGANMNSNNYLPEYYDRWQQPGDEAHTDIPSMPYPLPSSVSQRDAFYQGSEIHIRRGDNIRLQDIRLQYQWNNKHTNRFPPRSIQFFLYPNNLNLVLWRASDSYFDPDYSGVSSDPTAAPPAKTWTGGITINL